MSLHALDFGDTVSIAPPDLGAPLVIDNFAGGGGASTGIENAIGRSVDIAVNHDPEAIAMHLANHAGTRHCCQSINAIDPLEETGGRRVALAWYSPDCKDHSKAKGGVPREKHIRDLAWVVPHQIERLKKGTPDGRGAPEVILLENVEEFRDWGPLDAEGFRIKARKGEEFKRWVGRIRRLGYRVQWRELRACDYGAPTSRKRFYLCARRDRRPIVWPKPTHGKPGSPAVLSGHRLPWRTAAECIDWTIPAPSIFDRKRELKEATMRRIAHGVMRYVVNAAEPFIVGTAFTNTRASRVFGLDETARTATSQPEYGLVDAAIVPITHSGDDMRVHSTKDPTRTITTANGGEFALATATVAELAAGSMVQIGYGEREGQAPRSLDIKKPLGTPVAGGNKHAAVTAFLSHFYTSNTNGGQGDLRRQVKTVTSEGQHHAVVCAHMEQANTGMVGHPMPEPVSTIVGKGCTQRLVETTLIEADALPPEMMERPVKTLRS
jgi:DNA (cytosine-5)-methyltransferase 1